jgi:hypothetical protein
MPDKVPENQLALDLENLLDAGLVEYTDEADPGVRRYRATALAARLYSRVSARVSTASAAQ